MRSASRSRRWPQPARGIGVGIAFYFGGTFAGLFLPDVVKYLPFSVANAAVSTGESDGFGGGGSQVVALEANTALLLVVVWLIGALVVAAVYTACAEISG